MTSQETSLALSAVHSYFDGERHEELAMLLGSVLVIAATALLIFHLRDGFTRGLFAVVLLFGMVFGAGAISLLMRDAGLRNHLATALAAVPNPSTARTALADEKARIAVVLSKFSAYRFVAASLAALAIAGVLFFAGGWVHGAAAGLLLVAASQAVIDHCSEARASSYLERLVALAASP
jgi:hypothetical protein